MTGECCMISGIPDGCSIEVMEWSFIWRDEASPTGWYAITPDFTLTKPYYERGCSWIVTPNADSSAETAVLEVTNSLIPVTLVGEDTKGNEYYDLDSALNCYYQMFYDPEGRLIDWNT